MNDGNIIFPFSDSLCIRTLAYGLTTEGGVRLFLHTGIPRNTFPFHPDADADADGQEFLPSVQRRAAADGNRTRDFCRPER